MAKFLLWLILFVLCWPLALLALVLFGASDTLIAVTRFLHPIEGVRLPIKLLYWLGQWGIAGSFALSAQRDPVNR